MVLQGISGGGDVKHIVVYVLILLTSNPLIIVYSRLIYIYSPFIPWNYIYHEPTHKFTKELHNLWNIRDIHSNMDTKIDFRIILTNYAMK